LIPSSRRYQDHELRSYYDDEIFLQKYHRGLPLLLF
jgi:hypothetical protein